MRKFDLSLRSSRSSYFATYNLFNNLIQRNQSAAFSSGKVRPNHETNINIIARRTGKDVNSHTVLDGIITTIMATIQRINIIGSREGSRNRRRLKANQTGKKFRVGIKSIDVLAAQPVTTNLLKFMRASIKMIGVSNLQSFIASMTQKLTLSDISDESKNYLDKAGITTACLRI